MSMIALSQVSSAINHAMVECVCEDRRPLSLLTPTGDRAAIQPFIYNEIE
ncbi:hypothetical protein ACPWT1_00240 [Ramlibacter sp. MMS24-I3-19]